MLNQWQAAKHIKKDSTVGLRASQREWWEARSKKKTTHKPGEGGEGCGDRRGKTRQGTEGKNGGGKQKGKMGEPDMKGERQRRTWWEGGKWGG